MMAIQEPASRGMPLSPMRKMIAAHTAEAHLSIPHYRVAVDIEADELLRLRQELNSRNGDDRISVNDLLIKACATALIERPEINIHLIDGEIHRYPEPHIAVVVAVPGGVLAPVIRSANGKTLHEISGEMKALTERAAAGHLKQSEITGGTFTISNLGMYGVAQFDAIINLPQCAILAVGAAKPTPVIRNGSVQVAAVMRATLSADHRAIDGAVVAEFLAALRRILQRPQALVAD